MTDRLAGVSILILEDDRDTLELLASSLGKLGAAVRTASSAAVALDTLGAWQPHAIMCDLHLPEVDGYMFLQQVRRIPDLAHVPVIAISASHPSIERDKALAAGFAVHLSKPSKLSEIVQTLTSLLGSPN